MLRFLRDQLSEVNEDLQAAEDGLGIARRNPGEVVTIQRSLFTARVKGLDDERTQLSQERWRWFDPNTAAGTRKVPIPPQLDGVKRMA